MRKLSRERGFTLYELLITVLVVGVMMTIGVPNMTEFTANNRMTAAANDLHSAFLLARTEAVRARENVTLCASSLGDACDGGGFEDGWIVYVDLDGDAAVDGDDTILREFAPLEGQIVVNATDVNDDPADSFTFGPTGVGSGAAGELSTATFCDARGNEVAAGGWSAARVLIVTPLGRSMILRDAGQIALQGGCP